MPNLMAVSASPRNLILTIWNFLVSTSEGIHPSDPKSRLPMPETIHSFPPLPIKAFHFVQLLRAPFYLLY